MVQKDSDVIFETVSGKWNSQLSLEGLLLKIGFMPPHKSGCEIDGCEPKDGYGYKIYLKCGLSFDFTFYFKNYDTGAVYATSQHGNHYGREWTFIGPRSAVADAIGELRKKDDALYAAEEKAEKAKNRIMKNRRKPRPLGRGMKPIFHSVNSPV